MGLDQVEYVIAVEKRFDIAIRDEDASCCSTLGDFCDLIVRALTAQSPLHPPDHALVWEDLCRVTAKHFAVRADSLKAGMAIVNDLGAD